MDRYSGTRIFFIFSFPWITTIRAPYMLEANRRYGFWVSCKDPYTFILRYNIFYLCRTDCKVKVKTFGNSKNIQGESKKRVISGVWCKIVRFLCNSSVWYFINIILNFFLVLKWPKKNPWKFLISQNLKFRKATRKSCFSMGPLFSTDHFRIY